MSYAFEMQTADGWVTVIAEGAPDEARADIRNAKAIDLSAASGKDSAAALAALLPEGTTWETATEAQKAWLGATSERLKTAFAADIVKEAAKEAEAVRVAEEVKKAEAAQKAADEAKAAKQAESAEVKVK